jgi:hypothetical protein
LVGLVERRRLPELARCIGKRLLLFEIDLAILRYRGGEAVEASAQIREYGFLAGEDRWDRFALYADTIEVFLY